MRMFANLPPSNSNLGLEGVSSSPIRTHLWNLRLHKEMPQEMISNHVFDETVIQTKKPEGISVVLNILMIFL